MSNPLQRKTHGRIFVADPTKVQWVLDAIKELDEYEFSNYYIEDFVVAWEGQWDGDAFNCNGLKYGHKFEIDIDKLTAHCWKAGVFIWCVTGHREPRL